MMLESAEDVLLPRMSLLLSPKSSDYEEDPIPTKRKKPVSFPRKTSVVNRCAMRKSSGETDERP
jgi:hypothetical protein